jgi:hypothetical protein
MFLMKFHVRTVIRLSGYPFSPIKTRSQRHWKKKRGDVKQWVKNHNVTFKLDDMRQLCGLQKSARRNGVRYVVTLKFRATVQD